MMWCIHIT